METGKLNQLLDFLQACTSQIESIHKLQLENSSLPSHNLNSEYNRKCKHLSIELGWVTTYLRCHWNDKTWLLVLTLQIRWKMLGKSDFLNLSLFSCKIRIISPFYIIQSFFFFKLRANAYKLHRVLCALLIFLGEEYFISSFQ